MRIQQTRWKAPEGWEPLAPRALDPTTTLALVFGSTALLADDRLRAELAEALPSSTLFGCTTAGEILGNRVDDETLTVTAVAFERTSVRLVWTEVANRDGSEASGARLARELDPLGLAHVLVLSDGLTVNGSRLVRGLARELPKAVTVTGGLAGDGSRFAETLVVADGPARSAIVAAVGFYGDRLAVGTGSLGGWDPFGPERTITRSAGNVLFELDGRSALELYRLYLGEQARELPASGLHFPLSLRAAEDGPPIVRTIVAVDEAASSMTFAGDMPVGRYARFMKANFDRLVDGSVGAAAACRGELGGQVAELALLISCVGRRLVLKQRVEEEIDAARLVLGPRTAMTGFYSYGEIAPFVRGTSCELHNQTMTITTLTER